MAAGEALLPEEEVALAALSPEERSKARVRREYEQLAEQSEHFGWQLRLLDAGDYYVIFVRMTGGSGRVFVLKLVCDDYWQIAPLSGFIDPQLFEAADETTPFDRAFYPSGPELVEGRGPLPVACIKGHRDFYANNTWHGGWTVPPAVDHRLYHHVANVRNALVDRWT